METVPVEGLTLFFDADERDAAEIIRRACEKAFGSFTSVGDWTPLQIVGFTS
jgi:hypothetical protein